MIDIQCNMICSLVGEQGNVVNIALYFASDESLVQGPNFLGFGDVSLWDNNPGLANVHA